MHVLCTYAVVLPPHLIADLIEQSGSSRNWGYLYFRFRTYLFLTKRLIQLNILNCNRYRRSFLVFCKASYKTPTLS